MSDGTSATWRVWIDLKRKEEALAWSGAQPGHGVHRDSMGHPLDASTPSGPGWGWEQAGRVNRVRRALDESGPIARRLIAQRLVGIDLSTIWHILIAACQDIALYYGGAVIVGGVIGGLGGR